MTRRLFSTAACALALAVLAAPAAAQEEPPPAPTRHCTGGPFTLTSGTVRFHVAVDDFPGAATSRVVMRLYDARSSPVPLYSSVAVRLAATVTVLAATTPPRAS
mgnify:CR=1 FL=1